LQNFQSHPVATHHPSQGGVAAAAAAAAFAVFEPSNYRARWLALGRGHVIWDDGAGSAEIARGTRLHVIEQSGWYSVTCTHLGKPTANP